MSFFQHPAGPMGRQFGLKERVVAIESLTAIADAMKAARPGLLAQLGAGMAKEVDSYFARTVDTAQDLRDAIYRGGAKQLLMVGHLHRLHGSVLSAVAVLGVHLLVHLHDR